MKTIKTVKQIDRLKQKNINYKGNADVFDKYSYFQLVNAYKPIFASDVMNIDEIKYEVMNGGPKLELIAKNFNLHNKNDYVSILVRLNDKYDFGYSTSTIRKKTEAQNAIEEKLKKANYIMHLYDDGTHISDYIRLSKFEHELRNVLLKYSLIIEEIVKNVFCSYLNDIEAKSTFLLDASNYDVINKGHKAIKSMTMAASSIVEKRNLAMKRKINQDILPPYWMSIHSFMMNGVIQTIDNLSSEYRNEIVVNIFYKLTCKQEKDYLNTQNRVDKRKLLEDANKFFDTLQDVGYFRNSLAHNSPIYYYNISDQSLINYPDISYDAPFLKKNKNESNGDYNLRKQNSAKIIINSLEAMFGSRFSTNNKVRELDLSYIIFAIYNMIKSTDKNTLMKEEILNVYRKYNIVGTDDSGDVISFENKKLKDIVSSIEEMADDLYAVDILGIIEDIKNGERVIRKLQKVKNEIRASAIDLKKTVNHVQNNALSTNISNYDVFNKRDRYFKLTGIDLFFLNNL